MSVHQLLKSLIVLTFAGLSPQVSNAIQQTKEPIKIGLLIPDNKSLAARQGAELAIRLANQKAGQNGKHFILKVKSLEGPWGTGSKQAVSLIFDEKVCALMASCDGRNAHPIEQAATKSRVVLISAWSGDPTLSEAFVPWFFNCVPNYNQQADAFIEEIYNRRKLKKIAVVSDNDYDSKLALESFTKRSLAAGKPEPAKLLYTGVSDDKSVSEELKKAGVEGLIMFGSTESSARLKDILKKLNIKIPVFGSLEILDEQVFSAKNFENTFFISPGDLRRPEANSFIKDYQETYGSLPGAVASLSYDGMNLLIQAISTAGTDRESIQKALLKIKIEGATGTIKFDEKGNRRGTPFLMQIRNGAQVPVEKY